MGELFGLVGLRDGESGNSLLPNYSWKVPIRQSPHWLVNSNRYKVPFSKWEIGIVTGRVSAGAPVSTIKSVPSHILITISERIDVLSISTPQR